MDRRHRPVLYEAAKAWAAKAWAAKAWAAKAWAAKAWAAKAWAVKAAVVVAEVDVEAAAADVAVDVAARLWLVRFVCLFVGFSSSSKDVLCTV
jgi:hypothetical protein